MFTVICPPAERRVLTFGVSQVGRQRGWVHSCNDNFSSNVSLECVCRPMRAGKRSNPYASKFSLGGVPFLKTSSVCARSLHIRASGWCRSTYWIKIRLRCYGLILIFRFWEMSCEQHCVKDWLLSIWGYFLASDVFLFVKVAREILVCWRGK